MRHLSIFQTLWLKVKKGFLLPLVRERSFLNARFFMVASSLPSSSSRFSRLCEVLLYLRASAAEPIFAAIVLYSPKVNDVEKWPLFTFYYGLLCHENLSNEKRVCSIITTGYYLNASRLLVFFHYSKAKAAFNYANGVWVFNRVCVQTASTNGVL